MFAALCAVFSVSLVVADLVAPRLTSVGPFTFTAGMVAFPVTFIITDLVNERWGSKAARYMTWVGLGCSVLAAAFVALALALPVAPFGLPAPVFAQAFASSVRVIGASLAAFLVSQLLDIRIFRVVGPYGFLARATASTLLSQFVDTATFVLLAFGGTAPWPVLEQIAVSLWAAKMAAAVGAVPLLAIARRAMHGADPLPDRSFNPGL